MPKSARPERTAALTVPLLLQAALGSIRMQRGKGTQ